MGQNVLTNDFSWSKSRHEKFQDCRRAYYLHYYGSWGGWEDAARPSARQLWVLKKLANRFNWAGNVVHAVIRTRCSGARRPPSEASGPSPAPASSCGRTTSTRAPGPTGRAASAGVHGPHGARVRRAPPRQRMEAHLGQRGGGADLVLSVAMARAGAVRSRRSSGSRWTRARTTAGSRWKGSRCSPSRTSPSAMTPGTSRSWTGRPAHLSTGYEDQVVGYALYLAHRHRVEPHRIRCRLVFVNAGHEVEVPVDAQTVQHSLGESSANRCSGCASSW